MRENSTIVGKWYVKVKGLPEYNYQYEIYKKNNKHFGVRIGKNPTINGLTKKRDKYYEEDNSYGEYYTISGSLKFYDKDGLVSDYNWTPLK